MHNALMPWPKKPDATRRWPQMNLRIRKDILQRAKATAIFAGIPLARWVERAMLAAMCAPTPPEEKKP